MSQPNYMTSIERYRQEWKLLIQLSQNNVERIRDFACDGSLKVSKFRSLYWAILLRALNSNPVTWVDQRRQQRERYEKLKAEFIKNPHDAQASFDNDDPLSQSKQSVWNQYFNDQQLYGIINQDVVRTFPGIEFFRKPKVQSAMSHVLFYYAREHPYMSYRQGMHEILAPLLFVIYSDQQSLLHYQEVEQTKTHVPPHNSILQSVLHADYLEADTYTLFSRLMSLIESYYRVPNLEFGCDRIDDESTYSNKTSELEVIGQLNSIREKILAKEDLNLHNYLLELEIPLHIFGIRWLRLLFGREFQLLDLLMVWDAIFSDGDRFELPNYILVAMLIQIREKLLMSDFPTCMTYLMRYPTNIDVNVVLQHALHMQLPNRFEKPPNAFVHLSNKQLPRKIDLKTRVISPKDKQANCSLSHTNLPALLPTPTETMLNISLQQQARLSQFNKVTQMNPCLEKDDSKKNDFDVLREELHSAQTIIKVTGNKLQEYLKKLRCHTQLIISEQAETDAQEIYSTLDGIEELCCLLKDKCLRSSESLPDPTPIDQALEANEAQQMSYNKELNVQGSNNVVNNNKHKNKSIAIASYKTLYERPDNGCEESYKLLENLKEIELVQIDKTKDVLGVAEKNRNKRNLPARNPQCS